MTIFIDRLLTRLTIVAGRWMARLGIGGSMAVVSEGSRAPDFSLSNQDGKKVSLKDFAGKRVLLWWYPKADTPG